MTDATGAVVPNATVTVRNQSTGEERSTQTDSAGIYTVPALAVGTYRVEVKSQGMQTTAASNLVLPVSSTVRQDFTLQVAATATTVEITAAAPLIQTASVSVGSVVNQQTVQEIPLNGRHFVDLALLTAGTVTPPANGFLTAPLRGQGSFAFNTGGAREDEINFMINGINLSDPTNNQITFQPTINTVQEFKVDNSTYSPEYGRNAGAIVNIATRSGANEWHGEAYEYVRNTFFDARNFTDPVGTPFAPFKRNQFGGDGGGAIKKDKTFFFLSYEGLRQRQSVSLSTTVLSDQQRAQAQATSDSVVKGLLPLIPAANSPGNVFISSAIAPVDIDQGTANVSHNINDSNRLNVYYAYQNDQRNEPPTTQGNNIPGYGDMRHGKRQLLTLNETAVLSSTLVNEARLGYNRIHITFDPQSTLNEHDYGIDTGINAAIGLPQITVLGAFAFGTAGGFPQGRGDYSAALSDSLTWTHGAHTIKFGADYRRIDVNSFSYTAGTFTFPSINAFLADQATAFTANNSNGSSRNFVNSIGAFVQDSWKVSRNLLLQLGLRYDWYGTPTEAQNRYVIFDPASDSLQQVGKGGPSLAYNQSALNFQPRVGFAWNPFGNDKTVIRSAYAIMRDQPIIGGFVSTLASNPPFAFPINFAPSTAVPFVSFANALSQAGGLVSPASVAHNYKDAYVQSWNFNVQQQFTNDLGVMMGYFGSKGTDLNIRRNYNEPINGVKPFPALSASSPIFPGKGLSNIQVYESGANSNYNALWITATKRLSKGLQFDSSYTWSKSIDDNSRNVEGTVVVQDSYNLRGDRGLSDFDARHRWVFSGIYDLPFKGNRLVEGWEVSTIVQLQSGNPINFHTNNASLTGLTTVRPSVTGPVQVGFTPSTDKNATRVTYLQNPSVFYCGVPGTTNCTGAIGTVFGNLGRNVIIGPGFANIDFALVKNTKITEKLHWQIRADAFDMLNHPNFSQTGPNPAADTLGGATFNLLTGTRVPVGDSGSSRQIQLAMKLMF